MAAAGLSAALTPLIRLPSIEEKTVAVYARWCRHYDWEICDYFS